jgi:hypothetical protein
MEFEDFADINADLQQRLSSWRNLPDVVEHTPESLRERSINEVQVRQRQRRVASMCLNTVKVHDVFVAELKAHVENQQRDLHHQSRVEDEAAFALGVFEQTTALICKRASRPRQLTSLVRWWKPSLFRPWRRRNRGFSGSWASNRENRNDRFSQARLVS